MKTFEKAGVYQIRHIETDRRYIGSTSRIYRRWYEHRQLLKRGKHHSHYLQHAWNKYGESAFVFEILKECESNKTTLAEWEQLYMDLLDGEFNHAPIAYSRLGAKFTPAQCEVIGARFRGKSKSPEHRAKISTALKGKPGTCGNLGHRWSDAARLRMSIARKGKPNPRKRAA